MRNIMVILVGGLLAANAGAFQTITFDGAPTLEPDSQVGIAQYTEAGMLFKPFGPIDEFPPFRLTRNGGGTAGYPADGSAYLQTELGGTLEFANVDGSPFDLISVDLAVYSVVDTTSVNVEFDGFKEDGSMVTGTFTLQNFGGTPTFQTRSLGSDFTDLVRVEVPTDGYSLDNVVVNAVPEPATEWLLGLGGVMIGFWTMKGMRKTRS